MKRLTLPEATRLLRACAAGEISAAELAGILAALEPKRKSNKLARAHAMRALGRLEEAAREAKQALRARESAEAHGLLGAVHRALGNPKQALFHKQRAHALEKDPLLAAVALGEIGTALAALGRLAEARNHHERALGTLRAMRHPDARRHEGTQLSYLGVALHRAGSMAEARRAHAAALAIHRETKHRRLEGAELMHLGYVDHQLGRFAEAARWFDEALGVLREVGDRALEGVLLSHFGALEAEAGRPERAGPMLHEALAIARETKSKRHEATAWLHVAQHHLARGEPSEARACLERAKKSGDGTAEPEQQAWVLALLGDVANPRGGSDASCAIEDAATRAAIGLFRGEDTSLVSSRIRIARSLRKMRIARNGTWFVHRGVRVDLTRRGPLARSLAKLAAARGASVSWREVLAAAWPGERVLTDAGFARVRNAFFQLRRLGLADALQTTADGYRLDPSLAIEIAP